MSGPSPLANRRQPRACGADARVLDVPWRAAEYCVVDVETTGLDLRRDDIVSYGAVVVREGRIVSSSAVYGLVRPTRAISTGSVCVHALRAADLSTAPPIEECADAVAAVLSGRILVAHAAWIERAFLTRALRTRGRKLAGPFVDVAALARGIGIVKSGTGREPSLERLALHLGLPVHTPHHALGDALTTAELLLALAAAVPTDGQPATVRELVDMTDRHKLA